MHRFVMGSCLVKPFDTTPWKDLGKNHYLWVGSHPSAAVYRMDPSRSSEAFARFSKGLCQAPVVTDRYGVYGGITNPHQYCLAHLIRDFRKYSQRDGPDQGLGRAIEFELKSICKTHRKFTEGRISKRSRGARFAPQQAVAGESAYRWCSQR